jgi:uncharacterized heparinase superfamily protein
MRLDLLLAQRPPAFAALGLEAIRPLWAGVRVTGLKPRRDLVIHGDKERARDIYAGFFTLEGRMVECRGRSVFALTPPSTAFAASLHGFGWLKDLQASGRALDRAHARALVGDWLKRKRAKPATARLLQVRANRLQNWVKAAPFLLKDASDSFRTDFFAGLTTEIRHMLLPRWQASDRIAATLTLAHAVAGLNGLEALAPLTARRLAQELAQLFPGGMVPSRNGSELAERLEGLADLRTDFGPCIAPLEGALAHMTLSDGNLVRFHAGQADKSPVVPQQMGAGLLGGYARLAQGHTSLVLDAGVQSVAQSLLAFEFSSGPERIITHCGWPASGSARLQQAASRLAAHSAPCLGALDPAPVTPKADCGSAPQGGAWATASHQGWPGFTAERRLFLAGDGNNLRGEDVLTPQGAPPQEGSFILRFHLNPATDARLAEDGRSVLLATGLQIWSFTAKGAALGVEDSISLCSMSTPQPSRQMTLTVTDPASGAHVNWAFRRVA